MLELIINNEEEELFNVKPIKAEPCEDLFTFYGRTDCMDEYPDLFWKQEEVTNYTPEMMSALIKSELDVDFPLPTGDFVFIRHNVLDEKTESGFYRHKNDIQDFNNFTVTQGKVLAFGPLAFRTKQLFPAGAHCKIGQFASFLMYNNKPFLVGDYAVSIIKDKDITAMLPADLSLIKSVKKVG
jgi:co-chaperonin GroES (HSP10)